MVIFIVFFVVFICLGQAKIEVVVTFWEKMFRWACKEGASWQFGKKDGGLSEEIKWLRYGIAPRLVFACFAFFALWLIFAKKNGRIFTKNQLLCLKKCSILLQISHFIEFRQVEGIFKSVQKMNMPAYLHFG